MPEDMEAEAVFVEEVVVEDELSLVVSTGNSRAIFSVAIAENRAQAS